MVSFGMAPVSKRFASAFAVFTLLLLLTNTARADGGLSVAVSQSASAIDIGQSVILTATPSGGEQPYAFQWYNVTSGNSISGAVSNTITISGVLTGSFAYNAVVTDNTLVSASSNSVSITVNSIPTVLLSLSASAIDAGLGQSVTLTAAISDGTPPYTLVWSDSTSNALSCPSGGADTAYSCVLSSQATNTYAVNVLDSAGVSALDSNTVTVNPLPNVILLSSASSIDVGQSLTLTANLVGGTGPYTYVWTGNNAAGCNSTTCTVTDVQASNTYTVNVIDVYGQIASGSVVTVQTPTNVLSTNSVTTGDLSASLPLASGYPIYICGGGSGGGSSPSAVSFSWTSDAQDFYPYSSAGHQQSNVCGISTESSNLAIAGIGLFNISAYTAFTSASTDMELSHTLTYTVSRGGSFTVIAVGCGWSECGSVTLPSGCTMQQFANGPDGDETGFIAACNAQAAGSYSVIAHLDSIGGASLAAYVFNSVPSAMIIVNSLPEVSASGTASVYVGNAITLIANMTNQGSGGIAYQWYNGSNPIPGQTGATYTATAGATGTFGYYVIVTDSNNGQGQSNTVQVTVSSPPEQPTGAGGGGGGGGGGGSFLPSVTTYTNGNQTGYEISNFSELNSETLHINNKTFSVIENFITPSSAGVTINGQSLTLTLNAAVQLIDPEGYTYYAKLTDLSYLPIIHTITLLVFGQPNIPAQQTTTTIVPTTAPTTVPTTTLLTTTIPVTTTVTSTAAVSSGPTPSTLTPVIGIGVAIATAIAAGVAYSRMRRSRTSEE